MHGLYPCQTGLAGTASPLLAQIQCAEPCTECLLCLWGTRAGSTGSIRSRVECRRSERLSLEPAMGVAGHASRPVARPSATLQQ